MKKIFRTILLLTTIITLIPLQAVKASAPKPQIYYEDGQDKVIYLSEKNSGGDTYQFYYAGEGAKKAKSVKSSKRSVVEIGYVQKIKNEYEDQFGNAVDEALVVDFIAKKAGSTTISFKIGSQTIKQKIIVKKYVNPVSKITLEGVNGGKNFASKFKKSSHPGTSLTNKNTKKGFGKLKIKAASGWNVTSVELSGGGNDSYQFSGYGFAPAASKTLLIGPYLKNQGSYYLTVYFENIKTGGTQSVEIGIGEVNESR